MAAVVVQTKALELLVAEVVTDTLTDGNKGRAASSSSSCLGVREVPCGTPR